MATESILNNVEVRPTEIEDIIQLLQSENAMDLIPRITAAFAQQHRYLAQWKKLKVSREALHSILKVIRRYEANALQLQGKGLWILATVLEYADIHDVLDDATQQTLFDTLFRVAAETVASDHCTYMFLLLLTRHHIAASKIFQVGKLLTNNLLSGSLSVVCFPRQRM